MGQKSQPTGLRLGINRTWDSRWVGGRSYADLLHHPVSWCVCAITEKKRDTPNGREERQ